MNNTLTRGAEEANVTQSQISTDILGTYKRAPMRFVRGSGVELFDENDKSYLDFSSGIAVNALGYGDPGVAETIQSVLDTGLIHVSNLYRTEAGEHLARFLVDNSFASQVFFCNSGAEANEGAFKFARRWGRGGL
jgi:acetylornithine/N-succinyldiaminopimelate aminotransferase